MKLVIVHYHLRPGGIRRIIELATPHLMRAAPRPITRIILAIGQRADRQWHDDFAQALQGVPVEVIVQPSFNYLSEQRGSPQRIQARIRRALEILLADANAENCLVWAHNLGVGRNLLLSRELATDCARGKISLVAHHHDWWFDNRWSRWPEMRRFGFRTLSASARAVFPEPGKVFHAAINHADATILSRHVGQRAFWLPNLTKPAPQPTINKVRNVRRWLANKLAHRETPVWLLPCRTLRRKNLAEALLLTRWLRPQAWLVVTGTVSSADEVAYARALEKAALQHHWRLRLGVLRDRESRKPSVTELLAASEAVLLTSIQEGFGLPFLEAAASARPLIARRLPNIMPDLHRFGFRLPQTYDEIHVPPNLFDWSAERTRQAKLFREWLATMPALVRRHVPRPIVLAAEWTSSVPFSRLTLTAQLEVLARPAPESWAACVPLNPFLESWRLRASGGELHVTPWPRAANHWLSGAAYARRFFFAISRKRASPHPHVTPEKVQADFIESKLSESNLYPLLWNPRT